MTRTFGTTHRYGDDAASAGVPSGRYTVSVTASDGQGGSGTVTLPDAVDVKNVAPTVVGLNVTPTIDENGVVTLSGRIEDAGERDTHQVTIVWGDGTSETVAVDPVTRTFGTTHRYGDDAASAGVPSGRYTVSVTASDGQGGSGTVTLPDAVDVKNVAPTVVGLNVTPTIDENGVVTLSGRIEDAGERDTHQVTIVWGDGTSETVAVDPVTRTFGTTHRYGDDAASAGVPSGRYTVSVTASDGQGGSGTVTLPDAVDVKNVAPTVVGLNVTPTIDENGVVTLSGRIEDAGERDTHQVTIVWGDGTSETVAVDPVTRTFGTTHRYGDDAGERYTVFDAARSGR